MITRLMSLPIWAGLLVTLFLVIVIMGGGTTFWGVREQRRLALEQANTFANGFTDMVFAAATLAMASGNSKEVADAVDQFQHSRGIKSLRVLRGDAVRQQGTALQNRRSSMSWSKASSGKAKPISAWTMTAIL